MDEIVSVGCIEIRRGDRRRYVREGTRGFRRGTASRRERSSEIVISPPSDNKSFLINRDINQDTDSAAAGAHVRARARALMHCARDVVHEARQRAHTHTHTHAQLTLLICMLMMP